MTNGIALDAVAARLDAWLKNAAFPFWWEKGADHVRGGFFEMLDHDGAPLPLGRRARVQARQAYVYAMAGAMDWPGPWCDAALQGWNCLDTKYRRADGQFAAVVSPEGPALDGPALLYDQAFVLLALAQLSRLLPECDDFRAAAHALRQAACTARRHDAGGYRESTGEVFAANPQMHLLEAALAWCENEPEAAWDGLADELAQLALTRFIDPQEGFLREYFDQHWQPLAGPKGRIIEPGHQFEWAWLLERWGRLRGNSAAQAAAKRLYAWGRAGFDPARRVMVDAIAPDGAITIANARLWPQAEWIKACAIFAEAAQGGDRDYYVADMVMGAKALERYLGTSVPGLWHDTMAADGSFVDEPVRASSFYHIVCSMGALKQMQHMANAVSQE